MQFERTFGQRLREARLRAGYSQSDLEKLSGIPKSRISRYENGHVGPTIRTLERLARGLNVSEVTLLLDAGPLEDLLRVLTTRGVRIHTSDQAMALGNAIGDIAQALGMVEESNIENDLSVRTSRWHRVSGRVEMRG